MSEFFHVAGGFVLGAATALGAVWYWATSYLKKVGWNKVPGYRWWQPATWKAPEDIG